jgi:hypothetical protein
MFTSPAATVWRDDPDLAGSVDARVDEARIAPVARRTDHEGAGDDQASGETADRSEKDLHSRPNRQLRPVP